MRLSSLLRLEVYLPKLDPITTHCILQSNQSAATIDRSIYYYRAQVRNVRIAVVAHHVLRRAYCPVRAAWRQSRNDPNRNCR